MESQVSPLFIGMHRNYVELFKRYTCISLATQSLATQSWYKFAKKCDANFNVYLMLNLPQFRNSWTFLYRQPMTEKRIFLAFHQCKNYVNKM